MDRYDHSVTTLVNSFSTGQPCAKLVCHHKCGFNETPITNTSLMFLSLKTTTKNSWNTSSTASKTFASHWDNVQQLLLISFFGRMLQLAQVSVSQPVSQSDRRSSGNKLMCNVKDTGNLVLRRSLYAIRFGWAKQISHIQMHSELTELWDDDVTRVPSTLRTVCERSTSGETESATPTTHNMRVLQGIPE
jgi:hypothetical protein